MEHCNYTSDAVINSSNLTSDFNGTLSCYRRHFIGNIMGAFVTVLIAIIAMVGNIAVVIASFWNPMLRSQIGNLLVVYLSTVDILTAILVMIPSAISVASDYWPLGEQSCKAHATFNYTFACSSSFNLAVISCDRAIAVLYPLKYQMMMTTKVMIKLCVLIFLLSTAIGIACGVPDWTSYNYTEAVCSMEYLTSVGVFRVFTTGCFFCYYVPVAIISTCNILIIFTANKSENTAQSLFIRRDKANGHLRETTQNDVQMKKTIKSMIVVVVTYYVCFTPYALGKQVKTIIGIDMPPWFDYLSTIFIFIASATNPFIYAILRKDYRDAFKVLPRMFKEKFSY